MKNSTKLHSMSRQAHICHQGRGSSALNEKSPWYLALTAMLVHCLLWNHVYCNSPQEYYMYHVFQSSACIMWMLLRKLPTQNLYMHALVDSSLLLAWCNPDVMQIMTTCPMLMWQINFKIKAQTSASSYFNHSISWNMIRYRDPRQCFCLGNCLIGNEMQYCL